MKKVLVRSGWIWPREMESFVWIGCYFD